MEKFDWPKAGKQWHSVVGEIGTSNIFGLANIVNYRNYKGEG